MELPPAPWETHDGHLQAGGALDGNGILGLCAALSRQRRSRELGLQLRLALRDAIGEYSYLRLRGLQRLGSIVEAAADGGDWAELFEESQLYPELQIVPVILAHTLCGPDVGWDPLHPQPQAAARRPSSEEERRAALHLLQGCCLLDATCRSLAIKHGAASFLVEQVADGGAKAGVQLACLDAILALVVGGPAAVQEFCALGLIGHLAQAAKKRHSPEPVRRKCVEAMLLIVGQVLPAAADAGGGLAERGRGGRWSREQAVQDIAAALGPAAAAPFGAEVPLSGSDLALRVNSVLSGLG